MPLFSGWSSQGGSLHGSRLFFVDDPRPGVGERVDHAAAIEPTPDTGRPKGLSKKGSPRRWYRLDLKPVPLFPSPL